MNMEKTKNVLKKLVSDKEMILLTILSVVGTVLVWWVWTVTGMTGTGFAVNAFVTVFVWLQTWKYGYRKGLFSAKL